MREKEEGKEGKIEKKKTGRLKGSGKLVTSAMYTTTMEQKRRGKRGNEEEGNIHK